MEKTSKAASLQRHRFLPSSTCSHTRCASGNVFGTYNFFPTSKPVSQIQTKLQERVLRICGKKHRKQGRTACMQPLASFWRFDNLLATAGNILAIHNFFPTSKPSHKNCFFPVHRVLRLCGKKYKTAWQRVYSLWQFIFVTLRQRFSDTRRTSKQSRTCENR